MTAGSRAGSPAPLDGAGCFVAWHHFSRRGQLLSHDLGLELHLVTRLRRSRRLALLRYLLQARRTLQLLEARRPRVVFVQEPPVFAVLAVSRYVARRGARMVIDAHTGAFLHPAWERWRPLQRRLARRAVATLVTNRHLAARVESWGGRALVVPDIPMAQPAAKAGEGGAGGYVVVVCSFSPDEPLAEVVAAARQTPEVEWHVTGRIDDAPPDLQRELPDNVKLTGFLADD
ncbi:MAG: glycosyltransferase, partial [Thermoanaerobaculia bacterium]|nr:glycosyltransferase [Thermoanaerobaculia bacterium]